MASDQREASSSADPKGPERDFSTEILERKKVANRLVVDEAVNVDNFVVLLNLETMKKLQFFRGDTIQLKGNPYWSMMHTSSYKYGYSGSESNTYWSMCMELGLQIPVLNPAQTTAQRNAFELTILGSETANGGIKGSLTRISIDAVIRTQKIWRSLQAFGDIAFA